MSAQRVLRLRRADVKDDSFVLLHVVQCGDSPLDLKLSASESDYAYITTIKHDQVPNFRDQKHDGTDAEFGAAVRKTLLLEIQHGDLAQDLENVELVALVSPAVHLSLIWRRKIGEMTQRLGTIQLPVNDDEVLDTYSWAEVAALDFDNARLHMEDLKKQLTVQTETNAKLQSQLDNLVQAKQDHEGQLLHKFSELLNSKKLKIRDQQRLLATAKVDPDAVTRIAPLTHDSHKPTGSRSSKRKANARALSPSGDSSSDGFEDVTAKDRDEDMEDAMTPEASEDETEDDDEDQKLPSGVPSPKPPKKGGLRRAIGGKGKAKVVEKEKSPKRSMMRSTRASQAKEKEDDDVPPPKRELPFARKKAVEAITPTSATADDDDETDDEL